MRKNIFCLSLTLLASLQLFGSSSSNENVDTKQRLQKQKELITTFLKQIIVWQDESKKEIPHEVKRLQVLITEKKDPIESLARWEIAGLWRCLLMLQGYDYHKINATQSALSQLQVVDMKADMLPYTKRKLPAALALLSGLSECEPLNIESIKNTAQEFFTSRIINISKRPRKTKNNSSINKSPLQKNITLEQEQKLLNALNKAAKEIIIKHSDSPKDNSESSAFTDDPYEHLEAIDAIIDSGNSDSDDDSNRCTHQ